MQKKNSWPRPLLPLLALAAMACVVLLALGGWPKADPEATPAIPSPTASATSVATAAATAVDADAARTEVAVPAVSPPSGPTFEERVDELVRLGQQIAAFATADDPDAAAASDRVARERFAELMGRFDDAGERGLGMLATLVDAEDPATSGRKAVLQLVLFTECERRHTAATSMQNRSRIDPLVQSTLDTMPMHETATAVGAFALVQRPYLRACHEPAVLGLIHLAAADRFSRDTATKLLLTLWDNMQRAGERTSDELSKLALLHLEHQDPSQRTAAYRQLLKDERYRNLVLTWLREKNDQAVAYELASIAATELPPTEAIALLREISPVMPDQATPFLTLGFRAPEAIADGYRELLATNTHPATRRDMIIGAGMPETPLALELVQFALENDPSVDVRVHAVMCLSSRHEPDLGERAVNRALDDPAIADDPIRVGEIVFALQNLESHGHTNAVDRLGQRLRAMRMPAQTKELLERILARSLPGGLPSGVPGGTPR